MLIKRILFVVLGFFLFKIISLIPAYNISFASIRELSGQESTNIFWFLPSSSLIKLFSVAGLGVASYIMASIFVYVFFIGKNRESDVSVAGFEGKFKIINLISTLTLVFSFLYAFAAVFLLPDSLSSRIFVSASFFDKFISALTMSAGSFIVISIGLFISKRGIGNGISFIILLTILDFIPNAVMSVADLVSVGELNPIELLFCAVMLGLLFPVSVLFESSSRKIRLAAETGSSVKEFKMKINSAGIIPVIMASYLYFIISSILNTFAGFGGDSAYYFSLFEYYGGSYVILGALIIFFTGIYSNVNQSPKDSWDRIYGSGYLIKGIRPGKYSIDFLTLTKDGLTLLSGLYLSILTIVPIALSHAFGLPLLMGGTGIIILVVVGLEWEAFFGHFNDDKINKISKSISNIN